MADVPSLVLIIGSGRSGSTLLQRLLAQFSDAAAVGEPVRVWERAFRDGEVCGCGDRLRECPVWKPSLCAAGAVDETSAMAAARLRDAALRWSQVCAAAVAPRLSLRAYLDGLDIMFGEFGRRAGVPTLIDSSKAPLYVLALVLGRRKGIALVHLVRDPRAVCFSLQRKVRRPDVIDRAEYMPRYAVARSTLAWLRRNLLAELTRVVSPRSCRVRYEDLIDNPGETLTAIVRRLNLPPGDPHFLDGDQALLEPQHSVAGNPRRFETGVVPLRTDDEWRIGLSNSDRRLVSILTWPWRLVYRY